MSFSNAALLPWLALAAMPLLVHLLFRRKTRRVFFPSLRLLRSVDPHLARRRRLHELALLALRTAAIALAVLALARPTWGEAAGPAASDTAVVLDDSASMALGGESSAWRRAVETARGVFERMRAGDRGALVRVVAGVATPADGLTQDGRSLVRALEASERTDGRGSLAAALRRAGEALAKGTSPDRRLVLLTDLDASALADAGVADAARALPPGTRAFVVPVVSRAAADDVAVTRIALGTGPCVLGRALHVVVTVERRAGSASSATVQLTSGRDAPRTATVSFSPAGSGEAAFDVTPTAAGPLALVAEVARGEPDDFPPDDRRHLVVVARPRLAVALIDGDLDDPAAGRDALGGGALLSLALDPPGDGSLSGIRVTRARPSSTGVTDDATVATIRAADAVLLHDVPDLSDAIVAAVLARHREGAGLLVVAGDRCARAGRAAPPSIEAADDVLPARGTATRHEDAMPVAVAAPEDAALAGLFVEGRARLEGVTAKGVIDLALRADATVLLTAGDRPVLVRGPGTPAPSLLLAMPLAPASSAWALRPTFLAWLHGLVPTLVRGGVERPSVVVGEPGAPRPVLFAGVYDLEASPKATTGPASSDPVAPAATPPAPPIAAFAANCDLREADSARMAPDAAAARLGEGAVAVAASDLEATFSRSAPRDGTGIFLVLAALALLAETVFANLARKRLSAATKAALAGAGSTSTGDGHLVAAGWSAATSADAAGVAASAASRKAEGAGVA